MQVTRRLRSESRIARSALYTIAGATLGALAVTLVMAPAAMAQVSFSAPMSWPDGDAPRSVGIGDFNGDG